MPGIDFDRLRCEITMQQVLNLIRFEPNMLKGDQWYGYCPLRDCTSRRRSFSVNLTTHVYYCHACHSKGNQLRLWASFTKIPLHPATIDLCSALGLKVPWIQR